MTLTYSENAGTKDRFSILMDLNLREGKARILAAIRMKTGGSVFENAANSIHEGTRLWTIRTHQT